MAFPMAFHPAPEDAAWALGTYPIPATLLPVVPPIVALAIAAGLEYPPDAADAGAEEAPPM